MIRPALLFAALTLVACGADGGNRGTQSGGVPGSDSPEAAMAAGIDASVKDVAAARAASAMPLPEAAPGATPEAEQ